MRETIQPSPRPKIAVRVRRFISEEMPPYLRDRDKKPLLVQLRELLALRREYRVLPYHYVTHGLYRRTHEDDVLDYLPADMMLDFCASLNPPQGIGVALDKARFTRLMHDAGLAAVDYFCILRSSGEMRGFDGAPLAFPRLLELLRPYAEVFIKPRDGACGVGAVKLSVGEVERLGPDGLPQFLYGRPEIRPHHELILQRIITQHPVLSSIASASVNTVRIDTFLDRGTVHINTAVLRVGAGLACTDNWARGGLIVRIDLETGTLRGNGKMKSKYGKAELAAHPISGARFDGIVLPYWREVKELVTAAAPLMLPLRSLGWDVALTTEGPLLIEVNHDYEIFLSQHGGGGYRRTPFGRALLSARRANAAGP